MLRLNGDLYFNSSEVRNRTATRRQFSLSLSLSRKWVLSTFWISHSWFILYWFFCDSAISRTGELIWMTPLKIVALSVFSQTIWCHQNQPEKNQCRCLLGIFYSPFCCISCRPWFRFRSLKQMSRCLISSVKYTKNSRRCSSHFSRSGTNYPGNVYSSLFCICDKFLFNSESPGCTGRQKYCKRMYNTGNRKNRNHNCSSGTNWKGICHNSLCYTFRSFCNCLWSLYSIHWLVRIGSTTD